MPRVFCFSWPQEYYHAIEVFPQTLLGTDLLLLCYTRNYYKQTLLMATKMSSYPAGNLHSTANIVSKSDSAAWFAHPFADGKC